MKTNQNVYKTHCNHAIAENSLKIHKNQSKWKKTNENDKEIH